MHARDTREPSVIVPFVTVEPLEPRVVFRVEGVDVSVFQGAINWQTLRSNNKEFAFVRSSRTTLDLDPNFHANMAGAKAAGVITGPYHRALPLGDGDAGVFVDPVTDANRFYNAAKDYIKEGYLRPVLDAEDGAALGKAALNQWWRAFINEFERLSGVEPIIYANTNFATNLIEPDLAAEHDLWIARWNGGNTNQVNPQTDQPETPGGYPNPYGVWNQPIGSTTPSHNVWDFWQYTSNGDGIALGVSSARLDLDVFNGDLETMRRNFVIGHQWSYHPNPFSVGSGIVTMIQAEDYDMGGQGAAYSDTTPTVNTGGAYRTSPQYGGVDLRRIANTTSGFRTSDTFAGEWTEYTIDVKQGGFYKVDFRLAQAAANGRVRIAVDGTSLGAVDVPDTDSFDVFTTRSRTVGLTAGKHVLRLTMDRAATNGQVASVDWLKLSFVGTSATYNAGAGSYVRNGTFANQNFGNDGSILVKRSANTGNTREGYLRFDLSSLSAINTAKLRLTGRLSAALTGGILTNVHSATNTSWSETGLTWNNKPAAGTAVRGTLTVTGTTNRTYEVDLTAFLKSEFAAGRRVVTLVLKNPNVTDPWTVFASDESATPPQLVVT
jgi:GH25 family lysozyme M1 (1,4-beta-N-acetylmuramidase)